MTLPGFNAQIAIYKSPNHYPGRLTESVLVHDTDSSLLVHLAPSCQAGQTPCGTECCDDASQTCCQMVGECYPKGSTPCSWDICCPPGEICCGQGDRCCPDTGQHPTAVCCGTSICCPRGESCCNAPPAPHCCETGYCNPNGGDCCTPEHPIPCPGHLGGPFCTWPNTECCEDGSCPAGWVCCNWDGWKCCPPGVVCNDPRCFDRCERNKMPCGSFCCEPNTTCCDPFGDPYNTFCCTQDEECCPGIGCCPSGKCCPSSGRCCDPGEECCPGTGCCPKGGRNGAVVVMVQDAFHQLVHAAAVI